MTRNPWAMPTGGTLRNAAIKTNIPNALQNLQTEHAGAGTPSNTAAYMPFVDTTTALKMRRNSGDSGDVIEGPVGKDWTRQGEPQQWGAVSATTTRRILCATQIATIKRLIILTDTPTTSSSGNEWQFSLTNATQALELFSGTVGTFTSLGGVGGGAEMAANVAYVLTPDQNATLNALDVLTFTMTLVGSGTSLTDVAILPDWTLAA